MGDSSGADKVYGYSQSSELKWEGCRGWFSKNCTRARANGIYHTGITKPMSWFHYSENIHESRRPDYQKQKKSRLLHTRLFYSLQNSLQTTGSKEKETPLVLNNLIRNTCLAVKLLWSRLMCLMPTIRLIYDSLQIRRGSNLTMVLYFYTSLIVLLHSKVVIILFFKSRVPPLMVLLNVGPEYLV